MFRTALSPRTRARSPYFLLENALVALVDVAAAWISPAPRTLFASSATPFWPDWRSESCSQRRVRSNLLADGCRNCAAGVLSTVIAWPARADASFCDLPYSRFSGRISQSGCGAAVGARLVCCVVAFGLAAAVVRTKIRAVAAAASSGLTARCWLEVGGAAAVVAEQEVASAR